MGCTPSIHVSQAGVVFCRDNDESPSTYSTFNHQGAGVGHEQLKLDLDTPAGQTSSPSTKASVRDENWKSRMLGGGKEAHTPSGWTSTGRSTQEIRFGPMSIAQQPTVKVLLVFGKDDAQSDAFWWASEKGGFECTLVRTADTALHAFQEKGHDIVIIDNRHSKWFDGEALCRSIRNTKYSQYTVIVAVVKKSFADKEEATVLPLLNAGFDRWFMESTSLGICLNELVQLEYSELQPRLQLAAAHALFVALDTCKDLVHVTDSSHNIQYLNRSSEKLLGYRSEELVGKNILDLHHSDNLDVMIQQLQKGHEWEGFITCKRKTGDSVPLNGRIIPTSVGGGSPTHFVYVQEPPVLFLDKAFSDTGQSDGGYPYSRGSLRSLRKGSYDIKSLASDGSQIRRQSLAKLHSLTIEAPITKVITLILAAQEHSPAQVSQTLEKVVEILRSTELYSPQLMEEKVRSEDPVTTDLLGALLSQGPKPLYTGRRSSSESAVKANPNPTPRPSLTTAHGPAQLQELMKSALLWEFDIFRLEELTTQRPLVWLGMNLMCHFEVPKALNCDESTLQNWLTVIEANYHATNSYHNSTHAADVLQAAASFLEKERMKQILDHLDEATCLIAAAVHDVDHPGKSSAFLCNSDNDLAILYNDKSVLESHHAALTFKLTRSDERVNIFKGLDRDIYNVVRQSIIDMVLATEMTKHFEHFSKFVNVFTKPALKEEELGSTEALCESPDVDLLTTENVALIKRMLIKCADVSNPARPLKQCVEWARRIAEEYFSQTDDEKKKGLPVVMALFDRATCSIPKSQMGFVDYIINDMFEAWDAFIDMPELLQYLRANYQYWKEKEQQGITRLEDIKEIQNTVGDVQSTIEESEEAKTRTSDKSVC